MILDSLEKSLPERLRRHILPEELIGLLTPFVFLVEPCSENPAFAEDFARVDRAAGAPTGESFRTGSYGGGSEIGRKAQAILRPEAQRENNARRRMNQRRRAAENAPRGGRKMLPQRIPHPFDDVGMAAQP